jgi:flavin reductase (DIM6/NTAB) family NADH-FMN oxidoreductase RutF
MPERSDLTRPDSRNFRQVLGRLPTGVVIVTGGTPEEPRGLVCGSFMSVSIEPPLVAVCPAKTSASWAAIAAGGTFCANVLADGQQDLAQRFATTGSDKFAGVGWEPAPATGGPILDEVAAWIDCRVYKQIEAGDHWLVLGEVLELSVHRDGGALVFHGGQFHPLG